MAKRTNLRRIKSNQPYSVEELADTVDVTPQTVRSWIKQGMEVLDEKRPAIIMGFQALAFLSERRKDLKVPMQPDELFCFRCKAPRRHLGMLADYHAGPSGGRLVALWARR